MTTVGVIPWGTAATITPWGITVLATPSPSTALTIPWGTTVAQTPSARTANIMFLLPMLLEQLLHPISRIINLNPEFPILSLVMQRLQARHGMCRTTASGRLWWEQHQAKESLKLLAV